MKKIILGIIALNLLLALAVVGLALMAERGPYHPGEGLYALQSQAEIWRLRLTPGSDQRAEWALALAGRRLEELQGANGSQSIYAAARVFDDSLQEAAVRLELAPDGDREALEGRFLDLLDRAQGVLTAVDPGDIQTAGLLVELMDKLSLLQEAETPGERQQALASKISLPTSVEGQPVPFLDQDVAHQDYPLTGAHREAGCLDCHHEGVYKGTTTVCADCHLLPEDGVLTPWVEFSENYYPVYTRHYAGDCRECHDAHSWEPIQFGHYGVYQCMDCHAEDIPEWKRVSLGGVVPYASFVSSSSKSLMLPADPGSHYPGDCAVCHPSTTDWGEVRYQHDPQEDCSGCHQIEGEHYSNVCFKCHTSTEAWEDLDFDHTGYPECSSCHEAPAGHYQGECTRCHSTNSMLQVNFDHTGYTDCQDCHESPGGHWSGQCSKCHPKTEWAAAKFNHSGFPDCDKCHSLDSRHYPGACSSCHRTSGWLAVSFNHQGSNDCLSCHNPPSNHYSNRCTDCHVVSTWTAVAFDHSGLYDCDSCHSASGGHYSGQCSNCHNTSNWSSISFSHIGLVDCQACHVASSDHYDGQCSDCHNTSNWTQVNFNHTGYDNCKTCHDSPPGHWPNQCSDCHKTTSWSDVVFNHDLYTDCKSCHDRPANHPRGQCSKCHNSDSWEVDATPTPLATRAAPPTSTPAAEPTATATSTPTNEPPAPPTSTPTSEPQAASTVSPEATFTPVAPTPTATLTQ